MSDSIRLAEPQMVSQQSPTAEPTSLAAVASHSRPSSAGNAPNLIVIGAMKASTTTFYELITRHPNVWFPSEKEPHYFTSPNFGQPAAWEAYLRLFDAAPDAAEIIGEASTGYSKLPHFGNTAQRLCDTLDQPNFIYLVRDPVARTVSNYQHSYLSGHYSLGTTLAEAIEQDPILIDASCYGRQIEAYREVFGAERLLTIVTDQLHEDPAAVMRRVEAFLGLPAFDGWDAPLPQSNSKQSLGRSLAIQSLLPKPMIAAAKSLLPAALRNRLKAAAASTPSVPTVTDADRQLVFDRIADDLGRLRSLLGDDIDGWPSVQMLGEA